MKTLFLSGLAAVASVASLPALATSVTLTGVGIGPGGVQVSVSSIFDFTGNDLTITLQNTSVANSGQDVAGSTLTGIFWDLTGNPLLTPVSALLPTGSRITGAACSQVNCSGVTDVGGEFGYQATALPGGADRGISSSGYLTTGLPKNVGNFNNGAAGVNLDDPKSLDGINFGIVSAAPGFNPNSGLAGVPLITDTVVFHLTGVAGLDIGDLSHVSYQYGTALSELNVPDLVPLTVAEPTTLALFGLGLFGFVFARRTS